MRIKFKFVFVFVILLVLAGTQICSAQTRYAYNNFDNLISQLKRDWVIPDTNGKFYTHADYNRAYANINKSVWNSFGDARNFVFSMNVAWRSATETPNTFYAGCGLMFRYTGKEDYLFASLRMDGRMYFKGRRNGKEVKYGDYYYGPARIEASHNLTVIANDDNVKILVDGVQLSNTRDVMINRSGSFGLTTLSGSNKDWGTGCTFTEINYYIW